jgi:hypothetical protein
LNINATIEVPIKIAYQYNHKLLILADNKAGANERAGFIEAPEIKDNKSISRPTIPPIANPPKSFPPL